MKQQNYLILFKNIWIVALLLACNSLIAQNDTMYIYKSGSVWAKFKVSEVDSVIFYQPIKNPANLNLVQIPGGSFIMGSPSNEPDRNSNESQVEVTIGSFYMSKFEITNTEYADFLNSQNIGSDGLYALGTFPSETLVFQSSGGYDWGLHFVFGKWEPSQGFENFPVVNVTWYGAYEFAKYAGGSLPTEAEWEYACRAGTTTAFNTDSCLTNLQANYKWEYPYNNCINSSIVFPDKTLKVGSYAPNAFGLYDMHGNALEWCQDWFDLYSNLPQINPTGPLNGTLKVCRGGSWISNATFCRSAYRNSRNPNYSSSYMGFRIVIRN